MLDTKDEGERRIEAEIDRRGDEVKQLFKKIEELAEIEEANNKTQNLKKTFEGVSGIPDDEREERDIDSQKNRIF